MNPNYDTTLNIYINIHNQWGYPLDSFQVVVEHLIDFLVDGGMTPNDSLTSLSHLVDYQVNAVTNVNMIEELSDYHIMTDIENRFFELYETAKDLLFVIFSEYPELRNMSTFNVEDARVVKGNDTWALLEITGKPQIGRLLCPTVHRPQS